jgi:hypothetical protein
LAFFPLVSILETGSSSLESVSRIIRMQSHALKHPRDRKTQLPNSNFRVKLSIVAVHDG